MLLMTKAALLQAIAADDEYGARAVLDHWAERHFGDTSPGAATRRFHDVVDWLLTEWDRHAKIHIGDRHSSESDPLDEEDDEEGLPPNED